MIYKDFPKVFQSPQNYRVFDHIRDVPRSCFESKDMIVEKFLPELDESGLYCVRNFHFFGANSFAMLWKSANPIVNGASRTAGEPVEVDPAIVEMRAP